MVCVAATLHEAEWLFRDLEPTACRRMYLLALALNAAAPAEALDLARCMERFVTNADMVQAPRSAAARSLNEANVETRSPCSSPPKHATNAELCDLGQRTATKDFDDWPPARQSAETAGKKTLTAARKAEFLEALLKGANNQQLAVRFGLSPRQVNGLRLGFGRRKSHAGTDLCNGDHHPDETSVDHDIQGASERQQQEQFLRSKPRIPDSLDDVVRFLRQLGDIVVRGEDSFLLNARYELSTEQLIERANRKRVERGKPVFEVERGGGPPSAREHGPVL